MSKPEVIYQDKLKSRPLKPEGKISRRELLKLASPLGKLALNKVKCTGCGICVLECPTGALTASSGENDAYQLLFKHSLCIACSQCVEVCPEQCLQMERTLDPDSFNRPATVLFKDEFVRCSVCGSPIASRAMINSIKEKVAVTSQLSSDQLELCPDCKVKSWRQG